MGSCQECWVTGPKPRLLPSLSAEMGYWVFSLFLPPAAWCVAVLQVLLYGRCWNMADVVVCGVCLGFFLSDKLALHVTDDSIYLFWYHGIKIEKTTQYWKFTFSIFLYLHAEVPDVGGAECPLWYQSSDLYGVLSQRAQFGVAGLTAHLCYSGGSKTNRDKE